MAHSKFYNPSENLAIDEVIFSVKGRVIFRHYVPKKRKHFGIKIFKLCKSTEYTYHVKVYLGKDRQRTAHHLIATHVTVTELTRTVTFLTLNYLMMWQRNRVTVVGLSGRTGEASHRTWHLRL